MPSPRLVSLAAAVRDRAAIEPTLLGGERLLAVAHPLASVLPAGGVQRGSVLHLDGPTGAGVTSIALQLAAAATADGAWAAMVDGEGSLASGAVADLGVALERFLVVRDVPTERWANVVGLLCDAVSLVACQGQRDLTPTMARRLAARARRRGAVLVVWGAWPGEAALRIRVVGSTWAGSGVDGEGGRFARAVHLALEGRQAPGGLRAIEIAGLRAS